MTQSHSPDGTATPRAARGRRVRLSAEMRRQQILEAALQEFSSVGFEGATVERISRRVGLTKAGLYAHFSSKSEMLEALFATTMFSPATQNHWPWAEGVSLEDMVDRFLATAYAAIDEPHTRAIFRLLLSESARSPELFRDWYGRMVRPHTVRRQAELDECIAGGVIADNAVSRKFPLVSAPVLIALLAQLMLSDEVAEQEVAEIRSAHREMLLILLAPRGH